MVVAYGILCIIFTLTVTGDGMVKLWNMNSAHQPMGGWVAHPQAEVLSLDWCKYNQVSKRQIKVAFIPS